MTSLIHHQTHQPQHFPGSDAEALSYLREGGRWSCRLATPSPEIHLAGGVVAVAVGAWAGGSVLGHSVAAGVAVLVCAAALAALDLFPAVWTLTHREYADRYLAARVDYGDAQAHIHAGLVLLGLPVLCAVAGAFGLPLAHASVSSRLFSGACGAAVGLALGLVRVIRARHTMPPV